MAAAAASLFQFPYKDFDGEHGKWLVAKKAALRRQRPGAAYLSGILDRVGIETSIANRITMSDDLDPRRFKWVFYADSFMYPFDNSALAGRNSDQAAFMPLQTRLLARFRAARTSRRCRRHWTAIWDSCRAPWKTTRRAAPSR